MSSNKLNSKLLSLLVAFLLPRLVAGMTAVVAPDAVLAPDETTPCPSPAASNITTHDDLLAETSSHNHHVEPSLAAFSDAQSPDITGAWCSLPIPCAPEELMEPEPKDKQGGGCAPNCEHCDLAGAGGCDTGSYSCPVGHTLTGTMMQCDACAPNCEHCDLVGAGGCDVGRCSEGHALTCVRTSWHSVDYVFIFIFCYGFIICLNDLYTSFVGLVRGCKHVKTKQPQLNAKQPNAKQPNAPPSAPPPPSPPEPVPSPPPPSLPPSQPTPPPFSRTAVLAFDEKFHSGLLFSV